MKGLSISSLKGHPALIPLFACVGAGCVMSGLYLYRLAARSPDVSWNRRANPRPWEVYDGKNYKFYTTRDDYKSAAPKLD